MFVVGAAAACLVAERVYIHFEKTPSTVHEVVNLLIIFIIAIFGFPSGSRAFSGEFKETHFLFLHSLPMARERAWAALVFANLSASLLSIVVLIALRPSLLTTLPENRDPAETLSIALLVYFFLFCAGSCFSLLFRKVVLNYLAGFFVCAAVGIETMFGANHSGWDPGWG
jgi:ABC-type transport system involved in multi-copper enzyme maturation permease subunit